MGRRIRGRLSWGFMRGLGLILASPLACTAQLEDLGAVGSGLGTGAEMERLPEDATDAGGRIVVSTLPLGSTPTAAEPATSAPTEAVPSVSATTVSEPTVSETTVSEPGASEVRDTCQDQVTDGQETDTDCGGDACAPCGIGLSCRSNADCESGACNGLCLPTGCTNGVQDGSETDVDCGGGCSPCRDGMRCGIASHCQSGVCADQWCQQPTCDDEVLNGDETDVDCGGDCAGCANGAHCADAQDCGSAFCSDGLCTEPSCGDGELNGDETDVDCGGQQCLACAVDRHCVRAADCEAHVCDQISLTCLAATCSDGVRNGDEAGVDCGASSCQLCSTGDACNGPLDCAGNSCIAQICQAPTCNDGRQNQSESDVDCGGPCAACELGAVCGADTDCASQACDGTCQPGATGAPCSDAGDCLSGDCMANATCGLGALGASCRTAQDCASNACAGTCLPSGFEVRSNGREAEASVTEVELWVRADTAITWARVALLYFFSPEMRVDLRSRQYLGPPSTNVLALQVSATTWMLPWRTASTAEVPQSTAEHIDFQIRNEPWTTLTNSNDYSYRASEGPNDRIVVCERFSGVWKQVQGTAPPGVSNPCGLIVDTCAQTQSACEVLEREQ